MGKVERGGEGYAGALRIAREVVGVAFEPGCGGGSRVASDGCGGALAVKALEGEEDVTALPAPVEAVEVGIEGVVGREARRVGGVGLGVGAEVETQGAVAVGGYVFEMSGVAVFRGIKPGVAVR